MSFSSYEFVFWFLPVVLGLHLALGTLRSVIGSRAVGFARNLLLLAASLLFYGWKEPWSLSLLLGSSLLDLVCGGAMVDDRTPESRRRFLLVSVIGNLSLLGFFKYRNFVIASLNRLGEGMGLPSIPPIDPGLALPVGISFYTFQSMSYTIDAYRGQVDPLPRRRGLDFLTYVALFPQLVAGPIVRFREIAAALPDRRVTAERLASGAFVFMIGFAKKILIADPLAALSNGLLALESPGFADAHLGLLAYAFRIYFDFSGYSDMAKGLGRMLGFEFPENFDSPYRSTSITEFWRRWHISLSTWLRDYLYVPLGGNRGGPIRTARNLALTMLLGGLWHGAAWTFVAWGAWHGLWLGIERLLGRRSVFAFCPRPLRMAGTFAIVTIGWAPFMSPDVGQAFRIVKALATPKGGFDLRLAWPHPLTLPVTILMTAALLTFAAPNTRRLSERLNARLALFSCIVFALALVQMLEVGFDPFIYFRF